MGNSIKALAKKYEWVFDLLLLAFSLGGFTNVIAARVILALLGVRLWWAIVNEDVIVPWSWWLKSALAIPVALLGLVLSALIVDRPDPPTAKEIADEIDRRHPTTPAPLPSISTASSPMPTLAPSVRVPKPQTRPLLVLKVKAFLPKSQSVNTDRLVIVTTNKGTENARDVSFRTVLVEQHTGRRLGQSAFEDSNESRVGEDLTFYTTVAPLNEAKPLLWLSSVQYKDSGGTLFREVLCFRWSGFNGGQPENEIPNCSVQERVLAMSGLGAEDAQWFGKVPPPTRDADRPHFVTVSTGARLHPTDKGWISFTVQTINRGAHAAKEIAYTFLLTQDTFIAPPRKVSETRAGTVFPTQPLALDMSALFTPNESMHYILLALTYGDADVTHRSPIPPQTWCLKWMGQKDGAATSQLYDCSIEDRDEVFRHLPQEAATFRER